MKLKYFLRGAGVGILVTVLLLFAVNKVHPTQISDDEIMERAEALGMITQEEAEDAKMDANLDKMKSNLEESAAPSPEVVTEEPVSSKSPEPSPSPSGKEPEVTETPKTTDAAANSSKEPAAEGKSISVTIESGMVSSSVAKYLYQAGVVGSAEDFRNYLEENGYATKIRAGEYEIPSDAAYDEIVDILT